MAVAGSGNGGGTTVTLGNVNLIGGRVPGDTLFIAVEKLEIRVHAAEGADRDLVDRPGPEDANRKFKLFNGWFPEVSQMSEDAGTGGIALTGKII